MAEGVRSNNIANKVAVADELLANRNESTGLISVENLAIQLSGSGALADRLDNYETVSASGAKAYPTIADGLANTSDGEFFTVPGEATEDFLVLYQNNAGAADTIKTYPSGEAITAEANARTNADNTLQQNIDAEADARTNAVTTLTNADEALQTNINTEATARADADAATNEKIDESLPVSDTVSLKVPLVVDQETGKVLVWMEDGKIYMVDRPDQMPFVGNKTIPVLADRTKILAWLENGLLETISRPEQQPFNGNKNIPVLTDKQRVPIWFEDGLLNAAPVAAGFARNVDVMSSRFASFGVSLNRWRAALAKYRVSQSNRVKLLFVGDSWVAQAYIASAVKEVLGGTLAADSFHPPAAGGEIGTTGFSKSGTWTEVDASATATFPYGIGPSGFQIWSDATDGTITLSNLEATDIKIYRHNHGGTWRYQVDSGGWVTVNDSSDGLMESVTISGLSDAAHTLEIDTTGNAGVVAIDGFYSWRDGINGFELARLGNSGATSVQQSRYHAEMVQFIEDLQPDLIVTILGTNDQFGTPMANHYAAIIDLITRVRAVLPDMGFIHIVPPQSDGASQGTVYFTLADYRDATRRIVRDAGTEYLSLVDLMADWETENSRGLWDNWGHLNANGCARSGGPAEHPLFETLGGLHGQGH